MVRTRAFQTSKDKKKFTLQKRDGYYTGASKAALNLRLGRMMCA